MPGEIMLDQVEVAQALSEPVNQIVEVVRLALEHTEPEIAADVLDEGITMTGGGSLLPGLAEVIAAATGLRVRVSENALTCVALGAGRTIDEPAYRGALIEA
jgi:rod shape-determining protein MreB